MERHIMITGWSKQHRQADANPDLDPTAKGIKDYDTGYVVYRINQDGTHKYLTINPDGQITLKRAAEILAEAETLTGNTYTKISISDESYTDDHITLKRKRYDYNKAKNRLTIWEGRRDLVPIYENWDGQITRDRDALADCLL